MHPDVDSEKPQSYLWRSKQNSVSMFCRFFEALSVKLVTVHLMPSTSLRFLQTIMMIEKNPSKHKPKTKSGEARMTE